MTAKEKAEELVNRYDFIHTYDGLAVMDEELTMADRKQCALISVSEILEALEENQWQNRMIIDFYSEVKQEINNL